jgi:hypothetical protein
MTSIDKIQGRLENTDDRLEQFFASRQSRHKLSTLALKVFECHTCHLFSRPPITITTCCCQWLGCKDCAEQVVATANRCHLCNATWSNTRCNCIALQRMEGLKAIGRQLRKLVGSDALHEESRSSSSDRDHPVPRGKARHQISCCHNHS